jgi:putative sugar O-methyltransferase
VTTWEALTRRSLDEIEHVDPLYRPTNFWQPGLHQLLGDMDAMGLERFKSWPSATYWFYPTYGANVRPATATAALERAVEVQTDVQQAWLRDSLTGAGDARRDLEVARILWNHRRWPFHVMAHGEAQVGEPPQSFALAGDRRRWTKPYLNYLLCLAALSRHVDRPPRSVLEIGGGYGVLGEILMRRSPDVRYVDLDIPPLMTVASYYLRELFGERVDVYDDEWPGRVGAERSAVLPPWRVDDVDGPFDLFVNCFSFQEMEPHVVANYVAKVAEKDVAYVVSLNSRKGKPKASDGGIGVVEQVTSARIVEMFGAHGYQLAGRYGAPHIRSAGELTVLRSQRLRPRSARTLPTAARRRLRSWRSALRSASAGTR